MGDPHTITKSPVKYSGVPSNLATVEATKFMGPNKFRIRQYIINACCNKAQLMWFLIDTGGGYHVGALNMTSDHSEGPEKATRGG
jgi:hypothetical protein